MKPRHGGAVNLSVQGFAGYPPLFGGGALHAEPFATAKLSFPLTVGGAGMEAETRGNYDHFVSGRAGLRYRASKHFVAGVGITVGGIFRQSPYGENTADPLAIDEGDDVIFQLDFEWGTGHRWKYVGFSFGMRFVLTYLVALQVPMEIALVWFPTGRSWGIALHGLLGLSFPLVVYGGGGLGLVVQL